MISIKYTFSLTNFVYYKHLYKNFFKCIKIFIKHRFFIMIFIIYDQYIVDTSLIYKINIISLLHIRLNLCSVSFLQQCHFIQIITRAKTFFLPIIRTPKGKKRNFQNQWLPDFLSVQLKKKTFFILSYSYFIYIKSKIAFVISFILIYFKLFFILCNNFVFPKISFHKYCHLFLFSFLKKLNVYNCINLHLL